MSELEGYCLTPGCVKAAASLINTIDETVDPCTGTRDRGVMGYTYTPDILEPTLLEKKSAKI